MKFILDKDTLTIEENKFYNSGSVDYYEAEIQFDETWNDLTIEAIITKMGENKGISRSPINNKLMLDIQEFGTYTIGFVGYKIENEEKIYQISTVLGVIQYNQGAGEIETENEPIPTVTEWEIYIAQIQDMIDNIEDMDITAEKIGKQTTITITKKDGTIQEVVINDGQDGQDGKDGDDYVITQQDYEEIANIAKEGIDIPTTLAELSEDSTHRTVTDTEKGTWNNKGTYTKPENGIPKTDLDSSVQTSLGKADSALQSHQDISMKQNIEDNTLNTNNKTVPSAINEVNSIAKGANQAVSYASYQAMVTAFNSLDDDVYNVGQNIYIVTTEVPDLWISSVESTSSTYTYVDDATIVSALQTNGYIQVGYYKLSMLETQKVDLKDYVKDTDYAQWNKGGVIKTGNGVNVYSTGTPYATSTNYSTYEQQANDFFIGKGTLENVITGKELVNKTYVDNIVGDIDTILEQRWNNTS